MSTTARSVVFGKSRKLVMTELGAVREPHALATLLERVQPPFAVLLPAFDALERREAEAMAGRLLDVECTQLCCVGAECEELHDAIDGLIVERPESDDVVLTTWHHDPLEACEYFLLCAGAREGQLLSLISSHPELETLLEKAARLVEGG